MKIGTIYTLYGRRAGAELYFEKIIYGIVKKYPDITFVVYCNDEAFRTLAGNNPNLINIPVAFLNNQFKKALWLELMSSKVLKKDSLDLFWIPSGTNSFPGVLDVPTLITFHDFGEYHVKNKYDLKRTIFRKLICIPRSIKRATRITTVSRTTYDDLFRIFKPHCPVDIVYSGPSPREKRSQIPDPFSVVRDETGTELGQIILVAGRTDYKGKGLDIVLRAYFDFHKKIADAPFLIFVGPRGEDHDKFLQDITKLGLAKTVKWLGRVSDRCLDALYQMSKFVVFASRFEGFGFPLLEAMENDIPIISSDAGALPEVAGNAALLFKSEDYNSLSAAMVKMIEDKDLRSRLVLAGSERLKIFDWDETFKHMRSIFVQTIKAGRGK